ncbi:MAG: DUF3343 domain-containing protein [Ruminococcus sp.]|uniref:DUF3343 domain-containing protein n=1 Tax=Ruminococcus sp. TaxID=41978 RepID=UPI00386AD85E|nr:DUF3343 domain-containing protein [Ruminococcus sp.]MBQ4239055.1 DUF3343 domain-containing protein [Ruminococcus sp.]
MNKELILVPSVTYAMKAKGILDQYKIRSYIQRTPKNTGVKSCGYCLFVPSKADEAEELLRKKGIRVLGRAEREEL